MLERDNRDGRLQLEMFQTAKKLVGSRLPCNLRAVRFHIGHSHEEGKREGGVGEEATTNTVKEEDRQGYQEARNEF